MKGTMMPTIRKNSKRIMTVRIILLLLIVFNFSVIWVNSSLVSKDSDKTSRIVAQSIAKKIVKNFETLPKSQQDSHVSKLNEKIRSSAHFAEFVPLGLMWWIFFFVLFSPKDKRWYLPLLSLICSLVTSMLCALSDEIHQIYVEGRSFELKDIATDTLGALCGNGICILVYTIKNIPKLFAR